MCPDAVDIGMMRTLGIVVVGGIYAGLVAVLIAASLMGMHSNTRTRYPDGHSRPDAR